MKLIIDIDEEILTLIKAHGHLKCDDIDNVRFALEYGTPYNPSGDLISREALKDEVRIHAEYYADRTKDDRYNVGYTECACEVLDFIDNAPTVPTFTLEDMQNNWDDGAAYEAAKHDREKGEWICMTKGDLGINTYKCSLCGHRITCTEGALNHYKGCYCGATMKGGTE